MGILKQLLTGGKPGWVPVGHAAPETAVRLELALGGATFDLSACHAPVALVPFLIACQLPADCLTQAGEPPRARLRVRDPGGGGGGRPLGEIDLRLDRQLPAPGDGEPLCLWRAAGSRNRAVSAPRRHALFAHRRLVTLLDRNPRNLKMVPRELFAKFVLFCQPHPVVLVSYAEPGLGTAEPRPDAPGAANVVPMDLVGPVGDDLFLLGLHRDSPALPVIERGRRLAIATLPLPARPLAFSLGRQHRVATVPAGELPLAVRPSPTFGLPVPEAALTVREVELEAVHDLSSHWLLVTRQQAFHRLAEGLIFCHCHAFYQLYLERRGRALPEGS